MEYLVDLSTLQSAEKGLGQYGMGRYLESTYGTEGLSQLIDVARVVNIIILSDKIFTSRRIEIPNFPSHLIEFINLDKDYSSFLGFQEHKLVDENLIEEVKNIEELLGEQIVEDFLYEIESFVTVEDNEFVSSFSKKLKNLIKVEATFESEHKKKMFYSLLARTFQYLLTSENLSIPYLCHAYRAPIVKAYNPRLSSMDFNVYIEIERKVKSWIKENFGNTRLEFNFPTFFQAVVKEANTPEDIFKIAIQLRNSPAAIKFRELISEIFDDANNLNLKKYASIRRVAESEFLKFQRKLAIKKTAPNIPESIGAEVSFSPDSLSPKATIDLLKLPVNIVRYLREWKTRKRIAFHFKTSRNVYEILSLENDLKKIWGIKLSERHKKLLFGISSISDF